MHKFRTVPVDLYDRCEGPVEHVFLMLPYTASDADDYKKTASMPWPFPPPITSKSIGYMYFKIQGHVRLCAQEGRLGERLVVVIAR